MELSFKMAKEGFFDRQKVIDALDKASYRVLNTFGRKVRATAQSSLIYSDKSAPPGQPPHAHRSNTIARRSRKTGKLKYSKKTGKVLLRTISFLREYIFYAYDDRAKSVVIGPGLLNSTLSNSAPSALEHGGQSIIIDKGVQKKVNIRAHPFMKPAFEIEKPGLPALWANSVR